MKYENISLGEKNMKIILDKLLPNYKFIDNYRPDWLKNPITNKNLELDRYYPDLKIGFEFNGVQHRKKNNIEQWERDKIKKKLCGQAGVIKLVVYYKELDENIINKKIQDCFEMRKCWEKGLTWKK